MWGQLSAFALFYLVATTVGAVVASGLAVVAYRRRDQPAAAEFALLNVTVAGWCGTAVLARLGVPGADYIWHVNNIFVFSLIFVWFAFVLAYTGRSEWIRHPAMLALWSLPGAVVFTVLYPPAQSILVTDGPAKTVEGLSVVPWSFTDIGALLLVLVFLLDIVAFGLLAQFVYRSRAPYSRQVGAIIGARLLGLATGVAFYAGFFPYSDLSLVPAAFAGQSLVIAWALFRYDFLDVVPLTAGTIVDQMADAVVVLDADDRVVDYNPALASLIGCDESAMGRHVDTVLPGLPGALERDGTVGLVPAGADTPQRSYQPQSTPLYDHHDVYRGRLVVLRDVTLQQTRERTLEALRSATERFLDATDPETVAEIATETAQRALDCPYSGVVRYDGEADRLRLVTLTDELSTLVEESGLESNTDGHPAAWFTAENELWQVFERGEPRYEVPVWVEPGGDDPAVTAALFPLGEHGVFGIGRRADEGTFSDEDRRFARTLADSTETALDRHKREQELEASRQAVEQRTEQLQFFNSALRHDLRNAVMVIDANLEFLSEHVTDAGRSHLETVSAWVSDMTSLIETVSSLTDAITSPGHSERARQAVDLSAVLEERVDKFAESHDQATVDTDIPDGLRVTGDELVGQSSTTSC
ncbi:histidine kinase N-terminal 7TM domain-containing protein [Haloarcula salinisoli]|uniref:histidine kinase n=1 Tax=Haloarcula salinisoli TaxID=2487746 RepID=A0A8J8CBQ8_9EURY|nr:histidine kinase N-terminal 7TM domain-containing protein [Halomicroarcula salinisoli]MBX0302650.1 GAF domain-containing protein [Halomicroarcula salinisoli]